MKLSDEERETLLELSAVADKNRYQLWYLIELLQKARDVARDGGQVLPDRAVYPAVPSKTRTLMCRRLGDYSGAYDIEVPVDDVQAASNYNDEDVKIYTKSGGSSGPNKSGQALITHKSDVLDDWRVAIGVQAERSPPED